MYGNNFLIKQKYGNLFTGFTYFTMSTFTSEVPDLHYNHKFLHKMSITQAAPYIVLIKVICNTEMTERCGSPEST